MNTIKISVNGQNFSATLEDNPTARAFNKDFATNYSYTRLGRIDKPVDLEKILDGGNVRVQFVKPTS